MCLAMPARILERVDREGVVEMSGLRMKIGLDLVPEAGAGDWVLVHTGYAISVIDPDEARATLAIFEELASDESGL